MIKTIELSGFKSFADRTKVEFAEGISAIVGPNGSGKSNIVDAIKWVLGEQSVRKLRGNEMTDVIFNGSATRSAVNSAEVTISFDNSSQKFPLETPEVHVTRRVYRNGETEYLINRQASRLKDIRELLSGTGLGTQAYSIIEQGRVESLLQSSSVQRRTIFEEAAGIARFNAKKQEVTRRLERVDQNLLRLSDIVGEVENQLKNTKLQAGKAQLYRQYTARLQELRTESSLLEWRRKNKELTELRSQTEKLAEQEIKQRQGIEQLEAEDSSSNACLDETERQFREIESKRTGIREKIAGEESSQEHSRVQLQDLEQEILRHGEQLLDLNVRSGDTDIQMRQTEDEIVSARRICRELQIQYDETQSHLESVGESLKNCVAEREKKRRKLEECNLAQSRWIGERSGLESRLKSLNTSRETALQKQELLQEQIAELTRQNSELKGICQDRLRQSDQCRQLVETIRQNGNERKEELNTRRQELSNLKQRRSGLNERVSLLQDLLRKNEGLSPGVKEVLNASRDPESPFRFVHGLVADLIRVSVEAASLIELALGQTAQYIVVSPEAVLFRHIERNAGQFAGRVGFIWLNPNPEAELLRTRSKNNEFEGRPGVLGRADHFVETDPKFALLVQRLLGRTWIVENIAYAKTFYRESDGRTNFLTISGEYLASDGTLVVGPLHSSSGLISRRSELRSLSEQFVHLETDIVQEEKSLKLLENQLSEDERKKELANDQLQKAQAELEEIRLQLSAVEERDAQRQKEFLQIQQELENINLELEKQSAKQLQLEEEQQILKQEQNSLTKELEQLSESIAEQEKNRSEQSKKTTNLKIELAKSEERLDFLSARRKQFESNQQERQNILGEHHKRLLSLRERRDTLDLNILQITGKLAELYREKESVETGLSRLLITRTALRNERKNVQSELKKQQSDWAKTKESIHSNDLRIERLDQEQKSLVARLEEDYGIDLEQWTSQENGESEKTEAVFDSVSNSDKNLNENSEENTKVNSNENPSLTSGTNSRLSESNSAENDSSEENNRLFKNHSSEKLSVGKTFKEKNEHSKIQNSEKRSLADFQKEIDDLRSKLQKLGSVNLEAIEVLENLETRCRTLTNQFNDLTNAKKSILKIIDRINADSQRLFQETFDGVKIHFCDIFQRLFGGGHADLILEEPTNPLESGIEIVARPPGKELKSVMLLSGGEKTLTCVALLLALFENHPNPVCILDEVDAALDEGNVGRFVKVIQEFQTETQFLIVTHSKKTMSCAQNMYGVTMQDSGVSKLIAVQFTDVGEHGEILTRNFDAKPNSETTTRTVPDDISAMISSSTSSVSSSTPSVSSTSTLSNTFSNISKNNQGNLTNEISDNVPQTNSSIDGSNSDSSKEVA